MYQISKQECMTALFVIACYHWFIGEEDKADSALRVAVMHSQESVLRYA